MLPISKLLVWHYVTDPHKEQSISAMAAICFLGVLIGSSALALVLCIMSGFEHVTYQKMQTMHAPIIMSAAGNPLNIDAIAPIVEKEFPEVAAWSPRDNNHVIIADDDGDMSNIMAIRGIDPAREEKITALDTMITSRIGYNQTLKQLLSKNNILIGHKLAKQLGITLGDTIELMHTDSNSVSGKKITLHSSKAIVAGLFHTGIEEFDTNLILSTLPFLHSMFGDKGITQLGIALKPGSDEKNTIEQLKKRFQLDVISWKDLYPALVAALKLEKYAMFLILALITLVASMNIMSLLFMFITNKKGDIAILKANGLTTHSVKSIFLLISLGLSCAATITGLVIAYGIGRLLQAYPFITLPDVYYVSHLPIVMKVEFFVLVFVVVMVLSFLAALIPLRSTKFINIAHVLRHEA